MQDTQRILRSDKPFPSESISGANESPIGKWRGQSVSLEPIVDVDDSIFSEQLQLALGIKSIPDIKSLRTRQVSVEGKLDLFTEQQIKSYGNSTGSNARQAKIAQNYLRYFFLGEQKPEKGDSVSSLVHHYMSLQLLAKALQSDDSKFVAMLTPSEAGFSELSEWENFLKDAGDDPEKLTNALAEAEAEADGFSTDRNELASTLKILRFNPEKLKKLFRQAQNLPELDSKDKSILLEYVEDEIRNLADTHKNTIWASLTSLNEIPSQKELQIFDDLIETQEINNTFPSALKTLLQNYEFSELHKILPKLIKNIGDKIRETPNAMDKVALYTIIQELMSLRMISYFLFLIDNQSKIMLRLFMISIDKAKLVIGLKDLIGEAWISPRKFENLAKELNIKENSHCTIFFQRIMYVLREMPTGIFSDDATRLAILDAAQTATDNSVLREEFANMSYEGLNFSESGSVG